MRLIISFVVAAVASLFVVASAAERPQPSCDWRAPAEDGTADDPTGDPGAPWDPAKRLTDAGWRAVDEHFQVHHFGLFTDDDVAALEATPGVALGVLHPLPEGRDGDGRVARPIDAAAVQWPDRIVPGEIVLVAVGNARPGEDWVLHPRLPHAGGPVPPIAGPATAAVDPGATGFYRVHRIVGAHAETWERSSWLPERIDVNAMGLETALVLSAGSADLRPPGASDASPLVLASGSFTVRTRDAEQLEAPAVVNLSLRGAGSDLFILEVLPRGDELASSSSRNVRVTERLDFQVVAPPALRSESAFVRQLLPPGEPVILEIAAEIVSFSGQDGEDLDAGLSTVGFSIAPGEAMAFSPVEILPRELVQRSAWLEVWRPGPTPEAP